MRPLPTAARRSLAIILAASTLATCSSTREDGPLPITDAIKVEYALAVGEATTWGMPVPESAGIATLLSADLIGVHGLEILGVAACRGWHAQPDGTRNHCAPINAIGWPPQDVEAVAINGLSVPMTVDEAVGILVGVRLSDSSPGTIQSIRLTYNSGGVTYQVTEPWSLVLTEAGT